MLTQHQLSLRWASDTKNTRRCKRSIEYRANIFDTRHYSKNYCGRLEKYAKRDFAVAVPGLEEASLSRRLLASTYLLIQRHDILLRVDDSGACSPASATVAVGGSGMKVQYSRAVRATVVTNLARMVVIDRGQFERLSVPSEQPCEACQKPFFADTAYTKSVVPTVGELPGEYFVLYGCQHAKGVPSSQASSADDDEEQEGDEGYSQAFVCALCVTCSEGPRAGQKSGERYRCRSSLRSSTTASNANSSYVRSRMFGRKAGQCQAFEMECC